MPQRRLTYSPQSVLAMYICILYSYLFIPHIHLLVLVLEGTYHLSIPHVPNIYIYIYRDTDRYRRYKCVHNTVKTFGVWKSGINNATILSYDSPDFIQCIKGKMFFLGNKCTLVQNTVSWKIIIINYSTLFVHLLIFFK